MNKNKVLKLLITSGQEEDVLGIVEQERSPNQFGEVTPPVLVEYNNKEYILKRKWVEGIYIYGPSNRKQIDDLFD